MKVYEVYEGHPQSNTVLYAGTIYEGYPEGVSQGRVYLVHMDIVLNIGESKIGQLDVCPECETERVAAEIDDYICCWCRDLT